MMIARLDHRSVLSIKSRRSGPFPPYRPETQPRITPDKTKVAKVFCNLNSDFLMSQRDVVAKTAEDVYRGSSGRRTSYPITGLRRVGTDATYFMPKVGANVDAHCRHMDCRSGHLVRACHILVSGSVECSDGLSLLGVTNLGYSMRDCSYATLMGTTFPREVLSPSPSSSRAPSPPAYLLPVCASGDYHDQNVVPLL